MMASLSAFMSMRAWTTCPKTSCKIGRIKVHPFGWITHNPRLALLGYHSVRCEVVNASLQPCGIIAQVSEAGVALLAQEPTIAVTAALLPYAAVVVMVNAQLLELAPILDSLGLFADGTHPALLIEHGLVLSTRDLVALVTLVPAHLQAMAVLAP
jgi:hypothetical protein